MGRRKLHILCMLVFHTRSSQSRLDLLPFEPEPAKDRKCFERSKMFVQSRPDSKASVYSLFGTQNIPPVETFVGLSLPFLAKSFRFRFFFGCCVATRIFSSPGYKRFVGLYRSICPDKRSRNWWKSSLFSNFHSGHNNPLATSQ